MRTMLVALPLLFGCGRTLSKRPLLADGAHLRAEPQEIWTRPVEVSYHLGDEVTATSDTVTLLGMHISGDRARSASTVSIFGAGARPVPQRPLCDRQRRRRAERQRLLPDLRRG